MRNPAKLSIVVLLVLLVPAEWCAAGPPRTSGDAQWYNPASWQWPTMPWSQEPARIRKKSPSVLGQMNQSAKRGWVKTKETLSPSNLFTDSKPASAPRSKSKSQSEPGFWSSLFGPSQPTREVRTVNDFLSQPHPR